MQIYKDNRYFFFFTSDFAAKIVAISSNCWRDERNWRIRRTRRFPDRRIKPVSFVMPGMPRLDIRSFSRASDVRLFRNRFRISTCFQVEINRSEELMQRGDQILDSQRYVDVDDIESKGHELRMVNQSLAEKLLDRINVLKKSRIFQSRLKKVTFLHILSTVYGWALENLWIDSKSR